MYRKQSLSLPLRASCYKFFGKMMRKVMKDSPEQDRALAHAPDRRPYVAPFLTSLNRRGTHAAQDVFDDGFANPGDRTFSGPL
jgi:hypothetical protein